MFVSVQVDERLPADSALLSPTTTPGLHHHSCGGRARLRLVGCSKIRNLKVCVQLIKDFHGISFFVGQLLCRSHPPTQNGYLDHQNDFVTRLDGDYIIESSLLDRI